MNAHLWVSAPLFDEVVTVVTLAIALFHTQQSRVPKSGNSQSRVQNSRYATPRCLTIDDSQCEIFAGLDIEKVNTYRSNILSQSESVCEGCNRSYVALFKPDSQERTHRWWRHAIWCRQWMAGQLATRVLDHILNHAKSTIMNTFPDLPNLAILQMT
jgi:hypothetical protein